MDRKSVIRSVEEIPASRPGPISIVALVIMFGIILVVDNWSLFKGMVN
ncbi:MAG: hypothetical protein ACK4NA_00680 [Alphaproteobacteria bacterium]